MCNAISEGGRRCAAHRHDSLAAVNLAVAESGLTEKQVSDVFTELRREGRTQGRGSVDVREWTTYLRELKAADTQASTRPENAANIQKAFDGEINAPDKATFYALKNLTRRVAERKAAESEALRLVAIKSRRDPDKVKKQYQSELKKVSVKRDAEVPAEYTTSAVEAAQERNLPSDRSSVVAMTKVSTVERSEEPRVIRERIDSPAFDEAGYDPASRRMEVTLADPKGTVLAYRNVSAEQWHTFIQNPSITEWRTIANNEDHQYEEAGAAEEESRAAKCPDCGQFANAEHSCPTVIGATGDTATESPAPEVDPLRHPDPAVEGIRHIQMTTPEIPEQPITGDLQANPQSQVNRNVERIQVSLDEVCESPVRDLRLISKVTLRNLLLNNQVLPLEVREKINDAPDDTVFAVNDAAWISTYSSVDNLTYSNPEAPELNVNHWRRSYSVDQIDIAFTYNSQHTRLVHGDENERTLTLESIPQGKEIQVSTLSRLEERERMNRVRDRTESEVASGEVVEVEENSSYTRRFIVDGSLSEQPRVRFGKASQVKAGLKAGKIVVSPIGLKVPEANTMDINRIDDQGYRTPPSGYYPPEVTGQVGLRYNEDAKKVELSGKHTHLRCACPEYHRNYHCTHVDYVRRHAANIGRQNLPITPSHPLLTTALSRKTNVRVVEPEGRDAYISLVHPETATGYDYGVALHRSTPIRVPSGVRAADVDRDTLRQIMSDNSALFSIKSVYRVTGRTTFAQALKRADTEVPVSMEFTDEETPQGERFTPTVTGSTTFRKSSDVSDLEPVSHTLKCTCADYAENYDCKHVRGAFKHSRIIVDQSGATVLNNLDNLGSARPTVRVTEVLTQRQIFVQDDRSPEDVRQEIEELCAPHERAAAEREERERQAELQRIEAARIREEREAERERTEQAAFDSYRDELIQRYSQPEPGYTNDPAKFYGDVQRMSRSKEFDYAYEGVLNGATSGSAGRKFGVELEFVFPREIRGFEREGKLDAIARELHREGLTDSPRQTGYHSGARGGWEKWSFERDGTVDGEIVSPLLGDDRESWEQLEKVCKIVKKHGGTVNQQAGSHVHVSTGSYGQSTAKHGELNRTVTQNEDLMYRLAANPHKGVHRGSDWCSPNIVDSQDDIPLSARRGARVFRTAHASMLNMTASSATEAKKSHVEFRMWDATLDPGVIQRQVMASVAMTDHAEQAVIKNNGSKKPTAARKKRGESKADEPRVLAEAGRSKHNAETFMAFNGHVARFFDSVFTRQSDREKVMHLFASNKW